MGKRRSVLYDYDTSASRRISKRVRKAENEILRLFFICLGVHGPFQDISNTAVKICERIYMARYAKMIVLQISHFDFINYLKFYK